MAQSNKGRKRRAIVAQLIEILVELFPKALYHPFQSHIRKPGG